MEHITNLEQIPQHLKEHAERMEKHLANISNNPKYLSLEFLESVTHSPLNLAENKVGNYQIKKEIVPKGKTMTVVSHRNWFMLGYKPLELVMPNDRVVHKLLKGTGLLMSDTPQELFLQYEAFKNAKGNVLVGGLGLGMYPAMIYLKPSVKKITIVEKDRDVISLISPYFENIRKIKIIRDDIWHFIKTTEEKFNYAYIDIHYSTGAMEYMHTVLPMSKILAERFPNMKADFWGEEEMKAQYDNHM